MKKGCATWFWIGTLIVTIPLVSYLAWNRVDSKLNPVPTHVPLAVYCIDNSDVHARIGSLMKEVIDSDDVEFKYSYTSRLSRKSERDRELAESEKSMFDDFFSSTQKHGVEFRARKRSNDRIEPGSLNVYLDDETCTILHYALRW